MAIARTSLQQAETDSGRAKGMLGTEMDQLSAMIKKVQELGEGHAACNLLVAFLPLSLGWVIATWLAGGRGSAATSCLVTIICRSFHLHAAARLAAFRHAWSRKPAMFKEVHDHTWQDELSALRDPTSAF